MTQKKTTDLIDLSKLPDNRIRAADDFTIATILRDTLQLVEYLARNRKMPATGEYQTGFHTGQLYDKFLAAHTETMSRHVRRQTEKPAGEHTLIPLQWSFEAPDSIKKFFGDAGTHITWFNIETRLTIRVVGKVKPMLTYSGRSTLVNFDQIKLLRLAEYITKLNVNGGLPERVNKLEQIVEGLSKSAIYAANKPEDRAGAEALPKGMKERMAADEIYDQLKHYERWQKAAEVVLRGFTRVDDKLVAPVQPRSWEDAFGPWKERMLERYERGERLTSEQWRKMFDSLDKLEPEEAFKIVKCWVETFSEVTYTPAYAEWALVFLRHEKDAKLRKR